MAAANNAIKDLAKGGIPETGNVLTFDEGIDGWIPGVSSSLASDWESSNAESEYNVGTGPGIVGDPTLSDRFIVGTSDVPVGDTTTSGASMNVSSSSILEPTSSQNAADCNLYAGRNLGAGNGGWVDMAAGSSETGVPGSVEFDAGNAGAGTHRGGDVRQFAGSSAGGQGGHVIMQAGSGLTDGEVRFNTPSITPQAGDIWMAINNLGAGVWSAGASGSFTSQDGKTITVTKGIITSIV